MTSWFQNLMKDDKDTSPECESSTHMELGNEPTKEEIDAFLAKSMTQMSVTERQLALEDLHGIRNQTTEHTESVSIWLQVLDIYLSSIKRGTVFELAEAMDRSYTSSRELRMMFLRAELYDPQAAAKKIIKFFEIKRALFGPKKLVKKITLDDLDEDDRACLRCGGVQVMPFPDAVGRRILVGFPCLRQYKTIENELRARYYLCMSLLESEDNQKSGVVGIWYAVSPVKEAKRQYGGNTGLLYGLPLHFASLHFCSSKFIAYVLTSAGFYLCPAKLRARMRVHWGDHESCIEALSTFGIPKDCIPAEPNNANAITFLKERKRVESERETESYFTDSQSPSEFDVVFGRGRNIQEFAGNTKFRAMLVSKKHEYDNISRSERTDFAERIVEQIKSYGGRFLKKGDDGWEEVSDTEARTKVTMAFRSQRRLAKVH